MLVEPWASIASIPAYMVSALVGVIIGVHCALPVIRVLGRLSIVAIAAVVWTYLFAASGLIQGEWQTWMFMAFFAMELILVGHLLLVAVASGITFGIRQVVRNS
ncbi:hypothetical protein JNK62_01600 [bacterium]|nr:hypothetical protein [bacterium]